MACVTISLLSFVAYFAYKVYYQGEHFFIDPQAQALGTQKEIIVDEQRVAGNPRNNTNKRNQQDNEAVDVGAIDLEIFDGNADGNQGPPKPAAKGGMSGVAFDRAIREKMEQQKRGVANKKPAADIDSDEDDVPPP